MDVLDAAVYVSKWRADLPRKVQTVLWGPLQAKEMGFEGWTCQDGGETGLVYHHPHIRLSTGFATATLIVVNRLQQGFLTIYFGGYPADNPEAQRRTDWRRVVTQCELFLGRLCKETVHFTMEGELTLVDNVHDARAPHRPASRPTARLEQVEPREHREPSGTRTKVWEV